MNIKNYIENMMYDVKDKFDKLKLNMPSNDIINAFFNVHRHFFTPDLYDIKDGQWIKESVDYNNLDSKLLEKIYVDTPLVVMVKNKEVLSTSSQPFVMAIMLRDAKIEYGDNVLEIGSGSGYNAGIISEIVGTQEKVTTIEIKSDVADFAKNNLHRAGLDNIKVINEDGGKGYFEKSPYDSIIITCGSPEIILCDQLSHNGTISLPLVTNGIETLCSLTKQEDGTLKGYLSLFVRFLHFEGIYSDKKQFVKRITSLQRLIENHAKKRDDLEKILDDIIINENDTEKEKYEKRKQRTAFNFYLAITDKDAISYESEIEGHENGYALWHKDIKFDKMGFIIMFPNEVLSWGNDIITQNLINAYKKWNELGRPGINNYEIIFYPENKNIPKLGINEWVIKRKKGITVFKLK